MGDYRPWCRLLVRKAFSCSRRFVGKAGDDSETTGVENTVVQATRQSAEFSDFWINGRQQTSIQKAEIKVWDEWFKTKDAHQWFTGKKQTCVEKFKRTGRFKKKAPFLKTCRWRPSSRRSRLQHGNESGCSFMKHVGFPGKTLATLAKAISQLERLKSGSLSALLSTRLVRSGLLLENFCQSGQCLK